MRLLSFVIPCYRSEQTIEAVVAEIEGKMKTLSEYSWELILVNDCSPDNTIAVIKKLADKDERITVIDFARNFGQHSALMAGLEKINHTQKQYFHSKPKAIIYTILFSLLIPSMLLFQMLRSSLEDLITKLFEMLQLPEIAVRINSILEYTGIVTVAAMLLVILLTFTFLPSGKRKMKKQLPGSVFSCITWIFFTKAFGYFITRFWRMSSVYGTLAAVFLAAMWLKFIITFLFYGASLNRAIQVKISRECST